MSDLVIAKDLEERYDHLIHRRNQCLQRAKLQERADYWLDHEDQEVYLIERCSRAEQDNKALREQVERLSAPVSDEEKKFLHKYGQSADWHNSLIASRKEADNG